MRLYQSVSGATTLRLTYDGLDRIAEYDGGNALQRRYVHGPNMDEALVQYEGTGTTDRRFLSSDERGSIISLTDSSGALIGINKYDEYGNPQSTNLGSFGYTGQAWLQGINLWYYKARDYDPELGRFLQTDPIDVLGGINLYAYVGNDPINWIDPLGLAPCIAVRSDGSCETILVMGPPRNNTVGLGSPRGGSPRVSKIAPEVTSYPREKKLSQCMIDFLRSQGLSASNLGSITFHEGHAANPAVSMAFSRGYPAMTIKNTIFVQSSNWLEDTSPKGGSTYFEEIIHSIQWDLSGSANFGLSWITGTVGGYILSGDPHNSPLEIEAGTMSDDILRAYNGAGGPCPD